VTTTDPRDHGWRPPVAVAVGHVAFEDVGLLGPLLVERGYEVRSVDATAAPVPVEALVDADLLVVLGGPVGVGDVEAYPFLADERRALEQRLATDQPTLGVCLGAQLLASAAGAEVTATGRVEIGFSPVTLTPQGLWSVLAGLGDVSVLHWHGDQFEIPSGADRLAETPGFPNQAFRIGANQLGLQFHLEADHRRIEAWLVGHAHELATNGIDPVALRADAARLGPDLAEAARGVLASWLDSLALPTPPGRPGRREA
jgi:GMP synthase (glutamine-hydrolysing)